MFHSLAKRGLTHIAQAPTDDSSLGGWINYVYGGVIATLTAVEDPSATAYIIDDGSNDPNDPLLEKTGVDRTVEPELHVVKNRPITYSSCSTLRHLWAHGGRLGPFRGATMCAVYYISVALIAGLMSWLPTPLATISALLISARLGLGWNNLVISDDFSGSWFRRIPTRKAWLKVLPATALYGVADQLVVLLPTQLARMNGLMDLADNIGNGPASDEERRAMMHTLCRSGLVVILVGIVTTILILVPASVTLTRVQASLLPEDENTIVPFDRSFGGKVVPESLGGRGVVGILEAWRSFGWSSRIRLLKVYIKIWAMQVALFTLFTIAIFAEVAYFAPELGNMFLVKVTPSPAPQISP
ncbi:MAG: hypothetical protein M1839_006397 [Geoglossum umbratile]|nr:MAG: hypothetical protein M1839_006397 [Geoglossum umbratile]